VQFCGTERVHHVVHFSSLSSSTVTPAAPQNLTQCPPAPGSCCCFQPCELASSGCSCECRLTDHTWLLSGSCHFSVFKAQSHHRVCWCGIPFYGQIIVIVWVEQFSNSFIGRWTLVCSCLCCCLQNCEEQSCTGVCLTPVLGLFWSRTAGMAMNLCLTF
jgi:hypothetical protein